MQPQIAEMNAMHTEQLCLWRERKILTKAVKNQLTCVFGTNFTSESHENCAGCSNVSVQEKLECPHENYREFDENDLESNIKTLN